MKVVAIDTAAPRNMENHPVKGGKKVSSKDDGSGPAVKASTKAMFNKSLAGKTIRSKTLGTVAHDDNGLPTAASLKRMTVPQILAYISKYSKLNKSALIKLLLGD